MDNVTNTLITRPDSFGRQWIYVTDSQVRDHPKGHFGVFIWIICLWFACVGGLEIVLGGLSSMPRLVYGVFVFITAVGLVLRNRLAYLMALFVPMIFLIRFFSQATGYGTTTISAAQYYDLFNALIAVAVCFYMFEGDRPNFIFRRRYRSYRAESSNE
jgi:hypothetical protein